MGVKLSVIIPVYNCEKYIRQCVEALINQTLYQCEFIFINDGSYDNSLSILLEYKELDSRIRVITQKNQGVSVARNRGLREAIGDYIGFVDGDDYIENDYFERLYNTSKKNKSDIVFANWKSMQDGHGNILRLPFEKNINLDKNYMKENIYQFFIENDSLNSVCNKIYKRSLIINNKIMFPKWVALGEDAAFNIKAFTHANNCYYLDYAGYHYREVEGSATRDIIGKDYFKRALSVYEEDYDEFKQWGLDSEKIKRLKGKKFINNVMAYTYVYFKPSEKNDLKDRFRYVKRMINTEQVGQAIKNCKSDILIGKARYERALIKCIELKFVLGIYLLTSYSRMRNS